MLLLLICALKTTTTKNLKKNIKKPKTIFSISEIRLDSHLMIDSSSAGSHYGSRGALAWTPPHSVEGSTPTWTEGTPSFTESSSSGEKTKIIK